MFHATRCKAAAHACLQAAGERTHLLYFAAVFIEAHGAYAIAAGGCLAIGVAAEVFAERPEEVLKEIIE